VLAVAGHVLGDKVTFTNSAWRFSIDDVRQRLGLRRLVVINDLVAQALSIACPARRRDRHAKNRECGIQDSPVLVIVPGTMFLIDGGNTDSLELRQSARSRRRRRGMLRVTRRLAPTPAMIAASIRNVV